MNQFGAERKIIKLGVIGGNITLTIPKALARELNWMRRTYVYVRRSGPLSLLLTPVENPAHDPSSGNLRSHQLDLPPDQPEPRND